MVSTWLNAAGWCQLGSMTPAAAPTGVATQRNDEATITPRSATVIPAGKDSIEQPALTAHSYDRAWRLARRGSTTGGL